MADISITSGMNPEDPGYVVRPMPLLVLSGIALGLSLIAPAESWNVSLVGAGAGLMTTASMLCLVQRADRIRHAMLRHRLGPIVAHDPMPVLVSNARGRIHLANAAAEREFGMTGAPRLPGVLGQRLAAGPEIVDRMIRRAKLSGQTSETFADGCGSWSLSVQLVGSALFLWRVRDTGDFPVSSETEDAASEPVAALRDIDILELLPVPILKISKEGATVSANVSARKLLELNKGGLPPLYDLVEGMGRPISEWLSDAADGIGLMKPEIVRAKIPGKELYLQIALGRVVEDDTPHLIGILNDATELKTLEAQFVQSQKMQAIGQLAGGVAHDFNNLLTAISGHCDLLLLRHDESDMDYSDLIQIGQNANRAASLVGQLLAFSRKQTLRPQALELADTMSELTHLLNRLIGEKVTLDLKISPMDRIIRADRRQFEQVIMNLVVNARDAMPDGGQVVIKVDHHVLSGDLVRDRATVPAGEYVVVTVSDQGCGIGADKLPKIFEPLFTTKKTGEGTGLGLSTAYGIVKQTGGFIFANSTPGQGTSFELYFPAHLKETIATVQNVQKKPERHIASGEGVVLLVEDEAPVRAFASRALRMRGYTVLEAEDAEKALDTLSDKELSVDVFVTDVIMPGLDGPTWVKRALRDRPETRVVFMSGYAEESLAENQARIPNSVFLPKPFSLTQLTNVVESQIH